ncbi:hypothetical protein Tco_0794052 [Tanacetum coccineum]
MQLVRQGLLSVITARVKGIWQGIALSQKGQGILHGSSELNEVKTVFNQMKAAVDQCSIDKKYFDIQKKDFSLDNDRLLDHIICQDVMKIVMHDDYVLANVLHADNKSSDEELEELMKDQPLSADASPTALSPSYIANFNPEEDEEDPEEDPADYPADG